MIGIDLKPYQACAELILRRERIPYDCEIPEVPTISQGSYDPNKFVASLPPVHQVETKPRKNQVHEIKPFSLPDVEVIAAIRVIEIIRELRSVENLSDMSLVLTAITQRIEELVTLRLDPYVPAAVSRKQGLRGKARHNKEDEGLAERNKEIIRLYEAGKTSKEIARIINSRALVPEDEISPRTIEAIIYQNNRDS
jgi:hypothetical protein